MLILVYIQYYYTGNNLIKDYNKELNKIKKVFHVISFLFHHVK